MSSDSQTVVLVVRDPALYHMCKLTLAMTTAAGEAENLTRILHVKEDDERDASSKGVRRLRITEEKVRGVSLEDIDELSRHRGWRSLTAPELGCVAAGVLACLDDLHRNHGIIHGAVNLMNILVDTRQSKVRLRTSLYMQESFFGKTTRKSSFLQAMLQLLLQQSESDDANPSEALYWCAPEVFAAGGVDPSRHMLITNSSLSDVYSLGVTLLRLSLPRTRFEEEKGGGEGGGEGRGGEEATAAGTLPTAPPLHERLAACTKALQNGSATVTDSNGDLLQMQSAYGEAFLSFLAACVNLSPHERLSATELRSCDFIRLHGAQQPDVRSAILSSLAASIEEFLRCCGGEAGDGAPPTANKAALWSFPFAHSSETGVDRAAMLAVSSPLVIRVGDEGEPSPTLPPGPQEGAVRSAPVPLTAERSDNTASAEAVVTGERTTAQRSRVEADVRAPYPQEMIEDCEVALCSALTQTQSIMEDLYKRELALAHQQQQQQQPPPSSSPQTPSSSQAARLSPRMSMSNLRWTPHLSASSQSLSVLLPWTASAPSAAAFHIAVPTAMARSGDLSSPRPQPQVGGRPSLPVREAPEGVQRVARACVLLQQMVSEVKALQAMAPDFAAHFCEEFSRRVAQDTQTLSECVRAVDHLVAPVVLHERGAAATAEEAAKAEEARRRTPGADATKPLRTAEDWSQALTMPGAASPPMSAQDNSIPSMASVGGGAAALLYNKWLREHQEKAMHMV